MNFRFWLLGVELRKSLLFYKGMKNVKFDHAPAFICLGKYSNTFFSKAIRVFGAPLPCNEEFEFCSYI
jgi:hypothetical protein